MHGSFLMVWLSQEEKLYVYQRELQYAMTRVPALPKHFLDNVECMESLACSLKIQSFVT